MIMDTGELELRYGSHERQVVDVRMPSGSVRPIGLYYVHGGGWYAGKREDFHGHLEHFAERGFAAASTGYRIDEGSGFRDKIGDVTAGLQSFRELLALQAPEVERIAVLGSSAGAHLATMLALRSAGLAEERVPIAGCVSVNGPATLDVWPELQEEIRTKINWLQSDGSTVNEISPDVCVRDGCPPFLFLLAEYEHLFPHDHIRAFAESIEHHGGWTETVVMPETKHGFIYRLGGPAQDRALELIEAFLARLS